MAANRLATYAARRAQDPEGQLEGVDVCRYEKWMTDTKISISEKEQDTQMKTARMERQKEKLVSKTDDFKHNKKELEATLQYEADLQHACAGCGFSIKYV